MKAKNNFLVKKNISIKDAILKLKETGMKCLIITDSKNRLLGTLTDGDMRDIIVKKIDLNKSINNFFNKNPKFIKKDNYSNEAAKKNI